MPGGRFDPRVEKVRAGVYINVEDGHPVPGANSDRGIVLLPLIGHDYGPAGEVIEITAQARNGARTKLGYDISQTEVPAIKAINDALEYAIKVKAYIPAQGEKAKAEGTAGEDGALLSAEAKYGGTRGNALSYSIVANPTDDYDVNVFLDGERVERLYAVKTAEDVIAAESRYITFSGTGSLTPTAGVALAGGTAAETTNDDLAKFCKGMSNYRFNVLALPISGRKTGDIDNSATIEMFRSKIISMRDEAGKYVKMVVPEYAANHEAITSPKNGVVLGDGTEITPVDITPWLAGLCAGTSPIVSNTHLQYPGAVDVYRPLDDDETTEAVQQGFTVFTKLDDNVIVIEKDINTLTDFSKPKHKSWSHNRIMRTIDTICESIQDTFPPAKYSNEKLDWDRIDLEGAALLSKFAEMGALQNVESGDFLVDRVNSNGDNLYANVAIYPVDSAEKLYFTVTVI